MAPFETHALPGFSLTMQEYDALTRTDFWTFTQRVFVELNGQPFDNNFHIEMLAARLGQLNLERTRLAIALPPRSMKSIMISVALSAWRLGHDPSCQIICASYGQDLADKLAADCRQIMQSAWYRRLFSGTRLKAGRQAVNHFQTTAGGVRIATSVGGVLTGFGADLIIIDDPMKPEEAQSEAERNRANAWARHTLFTRLNDKRRGSIVIVMQRLHEDDMIGHVRGFSDFELMSFSAIAENDERHVIETPFGTWEHTRQAGEALHPDREPLEVLAELRRSMGSQFFAAQYLQRPAPPGGAIVKSAWFQRHDHTLADRDRFEQVIQSWDTASKASELSDYSVCTTWGIDGYAPSEKRVYLLDVQRVRLEYPDLKRLMIDHARRWRPDFILVEDTSAGTQLVQELRHQDIGRIEAIRPKDDKVMRIQAQTPAIEAGQVFLPQNASWLDAYLHELEMFPASKFDDQVDSTSQALARIFTPNSYDNFMGFMKGEREGRRRQEPLSPVGGQIPSIRLNHPNLKANFVLCSGREPVRQADGSFLVTEGELHSALGLQGVYRVPD